MHNTAPEKTIDLNFAKRFTLIFLSITITVLIGISSLTWYMDPLDLFGHGLAGDIPKPAKQHTERIWKPYAILRKKPQTVVLGSSRANHAINPQNPLLCNPDTQCFNLAVSGGNVYEMYRFLQHAILSGPVKKVIFGLDFGSFRNARPDSGFVNQILLTTQHNAINILSINFYRIKFSISIDSLLASINMFFEKNLKQYNFDNGKRTDEMYLDNIRKSGGIAQEIKAWGNQAINGATKKIMTDQYIKSLSYFNKVIDLCKTNDIEIYYYISPTHAMDMELLWQGGQWDQFEKWKKDITQIIDHYHNTGFNVILYDFSGYNSITIKQISTSKFNEFYWEPSHYKELVGDFILAKIFDGNPINRLIIPADFGVALNSANIDTHLAAIREAGERYRESHPQVVAEIRQIIQTAKPDQFVVNK